ncbi:MAG: LacI family DNA-binding transcriptional regulator [Nitratireductor sp.]
MAVTLKEVAALAGVSRSAVSRTFTDGASVSAKTREKVERASRKLGYQPNLIARSLSTNRTKLIGLIANNFHNPIFMEVFDLFTKALQKKGYRPLIVNLTDESDPEVSVQLLKQYNVDGVIIATSTLSIEFSKAFSDAKLPVVHAFGRFQKGVNVPVVGVDNIEAGRLAAQTLVDCGYKNIGFLGGPIDASSTQDRAVGFLNQMEKLKVKPAIVKYARAYAYKAGCEALAEIFKEAEVDALFCGDDLLCMGAIDEAKKMGKKIPDELGFIGFNNMEMAAWAAYDLTTISQPVGDIIKSSIDLIVAMLDEPDRSTEMRLFSCSIVERGTLAQQSQS